MPTPCISTNRHNENDPCAYERVQGTVIMVWDGLRPDSVNPVDTPNLYALQQQGVRFADNHSTYLTFTMMNGSSFATGSFPKTSGFYGSTFWTPPQAGAAQPIPVGKSASGGNQGNDGDESKEAAVHRMFLRSGTAAERTDGL